MIEPPASTAGAVRPPKGLRPAVHRARRLAGAMVGTAWGAGRGLVLVCTAVSLASGLSSLAYPVGFRLVIDNALHQQLTGTVVGVALVAVTFSAAFVLASTSGARYGQLTDRANLALAERIGWLANAVPTLEHFERPEYLREIDNLRNNRRTLASSATQILRLAQMAVQVAGIVVLLALIYPPVLLVPVLAAAPGLADRRAGRLQKQSDDNLAERRRLLGELFQLASTTAPARELRTFGGVDAVQARYASLAGEVNRATLRAARRAALWEAAGWLTYAAGFVAAIFVLVLRAAKGQASPGEVVEAVSLVRRAQRQVSGATDTAGSFSTAIRTAGRLLWLEDYAAGAQSPARLRPPGHLADGIRLEAVDFTYPGQASPSLVGIGLHLPAGATVALVGENGAGKTTLVKLLTAMYRPTAGRITVDGTDLCQIDETAWRAGSTATFQDFAQFQTRLGDGVGAGDLPRISDDIAVLEAMDRADARVVLDGLPDGLGTVVGSYVGGRGLSGGQWQRLALARGLMREAPVLVVLDEPTSNLDARAEAALFERYQSAARRLGQLRGAITLLVTHRVATVRSADLIVVLDGGRVVEVGRHEQLLSGGGLYAELFSIQAAAYKS
ncbi:MAG TPA: ABC transporter ATP-binding protein [Acidimicrobiales bacterium]|nr:ABC transporter ATP-binding protein [Acidimicrobiales bacterium]